MSFPWKSPDAFRVTFASEAIPSGQIMEEENPIHPAVRALRTVCRCNNIKYRTIERAIRDGARCIDSVAAKTTATTGYCGGTCTPVVQDMIEELGEQT